MKYKIEQKSEIIFFKGIRKVTCSLKLESRSLLSICLCPANSRNYKHLGLQKHTWGYKKIVLKKRESEKEHYIICNALFIKI